MEGLLIFKASAGSGKTHQITQEFLKILLKNPNTYRSILAVTFTNKAAEEMKLRILKELSSLAKNEESLHWEKIQEATLLSREKLSENAQLALQKILFDYSAFSVFTIDKFFQKIIRSFAWELKIQNKLTIELDQKRILREAIERIYEKLHENSELKKWLIQFSREEILEGRSWNIKKPIAALGEEVYKESYQSLLDLDHQGMNPQKTIVKLRQLIKKIENDLNQMRVQAEEMLQKHDLTIEDFPSKNAGLIGILQKIRNKNFDLGTRIITAYSDQNAWTKKSDSAEHKNKIHNLLNAGFFELYQRMVQSIENERPRYNTAHQVLKKFYVVAILNDVSKAIAEISQDKELFLISDSNRLLHKIIDQSDTPFIFEKTGARYQTIMIDEFQDTSVLQWNNFKPLIHHLLSENNTSILVGDIKQSIYRWRNGDWKILANQVENDFKPFNLKVENLPANWRSLENIVHFNNTIFEIAARTLDNMLQAAEVDLNTFRLTDAYGDVKQAIPKTRKLPEKGYIKGIFFESENLGVIDERREQAAEQLTHELHLLFSKGYKPNQIAILTRDGKESGKVVQQLLSIKEQFKQQGFPFDIISEDALQLDSSELIHFILAVIQYHINPKNTIAKLFIIHYLCRTKNLKPEDFVSKIETDEFIPDFSPVQVQQLHASLQFKSAPDAVYAIIDSFQLKLETRDLAYLDTFTDWMLDNSIPVKMSSPDLIQYWEDEGKRIKVQFPASEEAIQILTIHKSKGMEFEAVIIPFCDWHIDHNRYQTTILWTRLEDEPFNEIPLIPIEYSSKLEQTLFQDTYTHEKLQAYVDNLNLLYVAFTRAKSSLIFMAYQPKNDKIENQGHLLWHLLNSNEFTQFPESRMTETEGVSSVYEIGDCIAPTKGKDQQSTADIKPMKRTPRSIPLHFKHKFPRADSDDPNRMREKGSIYHEILARVIQPADLKRSLQRAIDEGKITPPEGENLQNKLEKQFQTDPIKEWFSPEVRVKSEALILSPGNDFHRPDRVMFFKDKTVVVDFKFGKQKPKKYEHQLNEYSKLLQEIGYPSVFAYLWYVDLEEVHHVQSPQEQDIKLKENS